MRIFSLLLVVTMVLLLSGPAFAVNDADIVTAIGNGEVAEMTATLLDSGDSEAVVATRMMASGADTQGVERGFAKHKKRKGKGHANHGNGHGYGHYHHGNGHGYGHGGCVSPGGRG